MTNIQNDYIKLGYSNTLVRVETGGGDDTIIDKSFAYNQIYSGAGDDFIFSSTGYAWIYANSGNDTILVQSNTYTNPGEDNYPFGYRVHVNGGTGKDILVIEHSEGHHEWVDNHQATHITLANGEHITAINVEEFHYV
jgi:Ca2+-binding RTX toxin-like protein